MQNFNCRYCGKTLAQRIGNSLFVGGLEIILDRSRPVICDAPRCQKERRATMFYVTREKAEAK